MAWWPTEIGEHSLRKLPIPTFDVGVAFDSCIGQIKDENFVARLAITKPSLLAAQATYLSKGAAGALFSIPTANYVDGVVSVDDMKRLYSGQFVPKTKSARNLYDQIMAAPKFSVCPLCGQRTVSTLDHYLAKTKHPALAITPANLVPACADCNKTKLASQPNSAVEQSLHPYFDDVDGAKWLWAEVVEESPPAVRFFADPPAEWEDVLRARVMRHFDDFKLGSLYCSQAGAELASIADMLVTLSERGGVDALKQHLVDQANSRRVVSLNTWQTAFYDALALSAWFQEIGFQQIR